MYFSGAGVDAKTAAACVKHLVAMKEQAEAAERLRREGAEMLARGGTKKEDVVRHFMSAGADANTARGEVERIAAALAAQPAAAANMKRCGVCGTAMSARDSFFDAAGNEVCRRCHSADMLDASAMRVFEAERNSAIAKDMMVGLEGGRLSAALIRGAAAMRPPVQIKCSHCQNVGAYDVGGEIRCARCGKEIL